MSETLNLMSPKFIGTHVALTDVITPNGQNIRHLGSVSRGAADPTVTMSGSHFMRQLKLVLLDRSPQHDAKGRETLVLDGLPLRDASRHRH